AALNPRRQYAVAAMIIVMKADVAAGSAEVAEVVRVAQSYPDVRTEVREIRGAGRSVTEIYLLGTTAQIPTEVFEQHQAVERAIRIREKYRAIGRHGSADPIGFEYNGVHFGQDTFHVFPG